MAGVVKEGRLVAGVVKEGRLVAEVVKEGRLVTGVVKEGSLVVGVVPRMMFRSSCSVDRAAGLWVGAVECRGP